jgi:CRP/FNR family transcriptional regulator, dissimilatory nitrate respiration regulator
LEDGNLFLLRTDDLPEQLRTQATSLDLARGDTLCRRGDPVRSLFALEYGRLQSWIATTDGKQILLYTVRSGECVLEEALFQNHHCSDVVAETRSRVRSFPIAAVKATLRQRPDLAAEFMALQGSRFSALSHSLELRSLRSARSRIMQFIRASAPAGSNGVRLDRTLKNIADDLGLTHEVFYRTLAQLIKEGLVRRTKYSIALREASDLSLRVDRHP